MAKYVVKLQDETNVGTPEYLCLDNPPVVFEDNGIGYIVFVEDDAQYMAPLTDVNVDLERDQLTMGNDISINLIMNNNLFIVSGKIESINIEEQKFNMQLSCDGYRIISVQNNRVAYTSGGKYRLNVTGSAL